jgi:hypothetical protein
MGLFSKLQNGDTVLKSLKFGKDRLGGGNSNQPYIQNPIIDEPGQLSQADNDFLFRNGIKAPINAIEDVTRLTKYMFDLKSPSGILFGIKQNLLSRISPKTEASKGAAYAGGALNSGVYTPLSTLAQAGVGFTGTHLNKQGIDPTGLIDALSIKKYEDVVKSQDENRLTTLFTLISGSTSQNNFNFIKGYSLNVGNNVITYGGGPGSILGIGKTNIRFADQRTGDNNPLSITNSQYFYNGGLTRPKTIVDYYNTLGASEKYGLTGNEIGLTLEGQFLRRLYNAEIPYSTLSFDDQGLILVGPDAYQTNKLLKNITQEPDSTYNSPIENILIGYKRQLTSPLFFQVGRTWITTSDGTPIADYSSQNTLTRDYTNTDVNNAGGGLWKDFNNGSKQHQEGYLADLDKNAGTWKDSKGVLQLHNNNAYPGGIAPDFRLTPREKRGLYKLPTGAQNLESLEPLPGYEIGQGETRSEYHNSAGNLEKNTLQRIYYRSDRSSFASTKNPFLPSSKDIIPFNITILNPTNLSLKTLTFRAYIDSLSDAYSADWKAQTYMGVGEKFWKYNSFGREIGFELSVVAENPDHLDDMYRNLNILAGSIAPTYTKQGYMAGNIHKITLGNYLINQYGIVTGLSYNLVEDSTWDITPGKQLPKYITVSGIKFTPIHNFRPEYLPDEPHRYINQTVNTNS